MCLRRWRRRSAIRQRSLLLLISKELAASVPTFPHGQQTTMKPLWEDDPGAVRPQCQITARAHTPNNEAAPH
jgi:hypothetical protein